MTAECLPGLFKGLVRSPDRFVRVLAVFDGTGEVLKDVGGRCRGRRVQSDQTGVALFRNRVEEVDPVCEQLRHEAQDRAACDEHVQRRRAAAIEKRFGLRKQREHLIGA